MFHTIIIVGNVGRDPEMRYTPSGAAVTSFSVATSRNYNSQGQNVKETIWFNPRIYTRSDGTAASSFEISATNLKMLSSRSENEGGGYNNNYSQSNGSAGTAYMGSDMGPGGNYDMDGETEDIPF